MLKLGNRKRKGIRACISFSLYFVDVSETSNNDIFQKAQRLSTPRLYIFSLNNYF